MQNALVGRAGSGDGGQNRTKMGKNRGNPEKISNFLWKSRFLG
jgi:hypothetical protein